MTLDFYAVRTGDLLPEFRFTITTDDVRSYVVATGEDSELWQDHVPPLALASLSLASMTELLPLPPHAYHTSQEAEFIDLVPADTEVVGHAVIERRNERQGMIFTTLGFELSVEEAPVVRGRATVVVGPETDAP